jgi:hypothetical protein
VAALDEARPDLGRDELLALEDANAVTAHPHEHHRDGRLALQRLEHRLDAQHLVLALVLEAERRRDCQHGLNELKAALPSQ